MKVATGIGVLLLLAGCAARQTPQDLVSRLDKSSPQYETADCQAARQAAADYDDKLVPRIGLSMGMAYVLGLLATPLALAVETDQAHVRSEVMTDLKVHCGRGSTGSLQAIEPTRTQKQASAREGS